MGWLFELVCFPLSRPTGRKRGASFEFVAPGAALLGKVAWSFLGAEIAEGEFRAPGWDVV